MNEVLDKKLLAQAVDAYEFRPAEPGDVDAIVDLYDDFFHESELPRRGLEYAPKRMWPWVFNGIVSGAIPHLLALEKASGRLVGSICYTMDHNFTERPFADLNKFYVRQRWRRSPVGRILLTLCLEIARADGAVLFNAGISSGMKETDSFKNLLLKLGFEDTNSTLLIRRF